MTPEPRTFAHVTARELLEQIAGRLHATHTIVSKKKPGRVSVEFRCSCGLSFVAGSTPANLHALRHVEQK